MSRKLAGAMVVVFALTLLFVGRADSANPPPQTRNVFLVNPPRDMPGTPSATSAGAIIASLPLKANRKYVLIAKLNYAGNVSDTVDCAISAPGGPGDFWEKTFAHGISDVVNMTTTAVAPNSASVASLACTDKAGNVAQTQFNFLEFTAIPVPGLSSHAL